jgi:ribosome modulation factor
MDPYDLYDMDEADEEETEEMKKDSLAWLHEQGYTHVPHHGRCVCPYYNLANRQWCFHDILQHASGIGHS